MTAAVQRTGTARPRPGAAPAPSLATVMRPELPSLVREVTAELCRAFPVFAEVMAGPYGAVVPRTVEQSLATFVELVADPGHPTAERDRACRRLGRFEAREGRGLEGVQAAFGLGMRLALRRAETVARRHHVPAGVLLDFTDALPAYVDELTDLAREGYEQVLAAQSGCRETHRRKLLEMLVSPTGPAPGPLAATARLADWPLPETVTPIAYDARAAPPASALPDDVLADLTAAQPYVVVPGPVDDGRRGVLPAGTGGPLRAAVGVTVPPAQAGRSLGWARQLLRLADSGAVGGGRPYAGCEHHLLDLWLAAEPELREELARTELAALAGLTEHQRARTIETLRAWLDTGGNAVQMAAALRLHPQTVRYRLRNLRRALGDRLTDPDHRFALDLALRSLTLDCRLPRPPAG